MKKQILQIPATRNRSLVTDKARVQSRNCLSSLFDQMFSDSSQNFLFFILAEFFHSSICSVDL